MGRKFNIPAQLATTKDARIPVKGRFVSKPAGSRAIVDGAVRNPRVRVFQIYNAPAGVGTRWSIYIDGIGYNIADLYPADNLRKVTELQLDLSLIHI